MTTQQTTDRNSKGQIMRYTKTAETVSLETVTAAARDNAAAALKPATAARLAVQLAALDFDGQIAWVNARAAELAELPAHREIARLHGTDHAAAVCYGKALGAWDAAQAAAAAIARIVASDTERDELAE